MVQDSEVITLIITVGVGFFLWINRQPLQHLYDWKLLFLSYLFYLGGAIFTVAEGFVWEVGLNLLEHISYLLFSISFLLWCWRIGFRRENKGL